MSVFDTAVLSHAETAGLMKSVAGLVLMPDDADFQTECATFNLMTPVHPAVAVGAICAADVQAAVRFAANRELPIAVLTTGHQVVHAANGAVLINMSRMNALQIDPTRNLARVKGGIRWQQVLNETDRYGLAPVSGTSPTVGVIGYHLGGGASPVLGRTHGYASDHIQAIEIVTADGELRHVTASSEPDLFWALRGGKGNFGVVTTLEFTLFPIRRFYGGGLFFAGEHAAKVLHRWREWVVNLPTEMSSSIAFMRLPSLPEVPQWLQGTFVMHVRFSSLRSKRNRTAFSRRCAQLHRRCATPWPICPTARRVRCSLSPPRRCRGSSARPCCDASRAKPPTLCSLCLVPIHAPI